jgi:probable phosphoglycerate mutase
MPKLYLVRHAEPAITGVFLGRSDPPLSARGVAQAQEITVPAVILYTSTLKRAFETARLMAHGSPVVALKELDELSLGEWDGTSWAEIQHSDPILCERKLHNWLDTVPPHGEYWDDFRARVCHALNRVLSGPLPAAIVSHFAVNSCIASILSCQDPTQFGQDYGQILSYDI